MGEEIGEIAESSTTPRIFRKEERLPAGVLKLTAEVPIAGLIAVGRSFGLHRTNSLTKAESWFRLRQGHTPLQMAW